MPDPQPQFDLFLSYNSEDEPWVRKLQAALQARGLKVWLDRDEILPGDRFAEALERGLEASRAVAIICSPEALRSEWVKEEYYRAVGLANTGGRRLRLIPVLLRDAELPGFLADREWVDFRDGALFEECVGRLCAGITWKKAGEFPPPPAPPLVSLSKLPVTSPDLFGREKELAILDAAWEDPAANILTIIAFGGIGKSALVNTWLSKIKEEGYRGAQRVFGWSFYSQGTHETATSSDTFINEALTWFGDPEPHPVGVWQRVQRLVSLIRCRRTLLILDGLEPLQSCASQDQGQVKDTALRYLLKELAREMNGLCLVSSRVPVADLPASEDSGPVRLLSLDRLSTAAGRQLLRHRQIKGPDEDLDAAVEEYQGHALALTLLATHLAEFGGRDIARRIAIPMLEEGDEASGGRQAFRMLRAYDEAFAAAGRQVERTILRLLGLFDRPASADCLAALREAPAIPDVTNAVVSLPDNHWQRAVKRLRDIRLLSRPDSDPDDGTLDAHPLLREYFGPKLAAESPDGFRQAHGRLFDHLCKTTKEFPDTLEEMELLFQAVHHGCRAGRYQRAFEEVYWNRIKRGTADFEVSSFGLCGASLAVLSGFFTQRWHQPVHAMSDVSKGHLASAVASRLFAIGETRDALEAVRVSYELAKIARDWDQAATNACDLLRVQIAAGDLAQAVQTGSEAVSLTEQSDDSFLRCAIRATAAVPVFLNGSISVAKRSLADATGQMPRHDPRYPRFYGYTEFSYCRLLIDIGEAEKACALATATMADAERRHWPHVVNGAHFILGRSLVELALSARRKGDAIAMDLFQRAGHHLEQRVLGNYESSMYRRLPPSLTARALLRRYTQDTDCARADVRQAIDLASRFGLPVDEADAYILEGYLALDLKPPYTETAQRALIRAERLLRQTGYHLREADLLILEGRLVAALGNRHAGRAGLRKAIETARREPDAIYQLAVGEATRCLEEIG